MNLQLFGYDDGFYYGQCKLICEVETLDGNGKTVTISDGTNNWSATVQNKIAAFLLPPRNKYTVTLINGAKSEYVKDVALGYGECYHLMLADGYDPIMQRDKLSLQEIAASTGNIDGYVPDAAAVKELNSNLVANGTNFVFDYKDGKYGYNTDPNRGADSFFPFNKEFETCDYLGHAQHGTDWANLDLDITDYKMIIFIGWSYDASIGAVQFKADNIGLVLLNTIYELPPSNNFEKVYICLNTTDATRMKAGLYSGYHHATSSLHAWGLK